LVAGLALALAGISVLLVERTFDARAFERPTYFARGAELGQLLAVAERERERSAYASSFERALRGFSAFLTRSSASGAPGREVVLASDLHNNALVIEPLRRFVEGQPVLLAGDFGHDGNEREAELLAPKLADLSRDALAVSGNHDSSGLMRSLARVGVTVLGDSDQASAGQGPAAEQVANVDGLTIAGFPDPLEWPGDDPSDPDRVFSFAELEDGEVRAQAAIEELVAWFDGLQPPPDIVVVHQNGLAQGLAERLWEGGYEEPLTIATGHDHRQHVDRYGPIVVVDGGTVGAGGVFGIGQEFASLAELRFDRDDPALRSVDLISVEPLSGRAQAERVVVDSVCPLEDATDEPCHYEPGSP
jgi:predicted phosphodiesterase